MKEFLQKYINGYDGKILSISIENEMQSITMIFQLQNKDFEWFDVTIKFDNIISFRFQLLEKFQNTVLYEGIQYISNNKAHYFCFQPYGPLETIDEYQESESFIICNSFTILKEQKS